MWPDDRLFDDEAFSERHTGKSAELGVAAFNELLERRAGQASGHRRLT
jgi:hypothetical protein